MMTTQPNMGSVSALPAIPPMPAVARILARFERDQLAGFIAVALDLLDTLDGPEDAEDDDPCGQCDEDGINTDLERACTGSPGCDISDPDYAVDDQRCDEPYQDRECEQMQGDVPMLPVFTAAHNIFTDQRVSLGIGNLQSSFRTNGGEVRSADTGQPFRSQHDGWRVPTGEPV